LKQTLPVFVIFSLLIICVTLSAGCGWTEDVGYHRTHTLVLSKFLPDGSMDWSKTYDTLGDVNGYHIIQMPRGEYLISASVPNPEHFCVYQGSLIRISDGGDVVSTNISTHQQCTNFPFITAGGDILSIGGSEVCRISPDGLVISNFSVAVSGNSMIQTRDGGYLIAGFSTDLPTTTTYQEIVVEKRDPNGTEMWQFPYKSGEFDLPGPVYESADGTGYSVYAGTSGNYDKTTSQQVFIQLTNDGKLKKIVDLAGVPERKFVLHNQSSGQRNTPVVVKKPPTLVFFDPNGNIVEKQFLNPGYTGVTKISDNEFIAMHGRNPVKFDATGKIEWEALVPDSAITGEVSQAIPTIDGGVMVISNTRKSSTTWP